MNLNECKSLKSIRGPTPLEIQPCKEISSPSHFYIS